ncbi:MAG: hypothetical protein ABFD25_03405 [Clostridiaceae bacterium]
MESAENVNLANDEIIKNGIRELNSILQLNYTKDKNFRDKLFDLISKKTKNKNFLSLIAHVLPKF